MTLDITSRRGRLTAYYHLWLADHGFIRSAYRNLFTVAPGVYRSSQPSPLHFQKLKKLGVRTVLNLRGVSPKGFYLLEREAAERHGMRVVDFVVRSRELPPAETLHAARDLFAEIEYPILIHCKSGADRAGFMSALFLMVHEGKPPEEALGQLKWLYGHYRVARTGVLDAFFVEYMAARDATGIEFWDWVDTAYDPDAIKRDFRAARIQSFIVDQVLKRE